jgi:tetratricopeptide (TPR) repeat protein/predicted Ser/Thr protein kinase
MIDPTPAASDVAALGRLGHYRIVRKIAEGGMGAVYEAEQDNPRRTVALKVIRQGFPSEALLRRFEHEAQILGRLHHAGIAQVFEAGTASTPSGPQPFFVMELIDGRPLTQFADQRGLDLRARLELMVRICDAVHHAHQKGVIHRDLKPANILVEESGQPKILDFGVARATDSDLRSATMQTDVGQLLGTLPYMSPEQVAADPLDLDIRSDVYALGVILYELVCGRPPYDLGGKMLHEAVHVIREVDPVPLSSINRVLRGDVEIIVEKALEKDKTRRYASAAELAADIERHLRDEPIVARPASTIYQLKKFTRRNKALVFGLAAVFVVLVAGIVVSRWQAVRAVRAEELANQRLIEVNEALTQVETKRKEAEKNFAMARNAVARYLDGVSDSTELKAHGLEPLRKHLLETAREFYEKFAQQHAQDPALQADLAEAHLRLGNILREMGDSAGAIDNYQRSTELYDALAKAEGKGSHYELQALVACSDLGLALSNRGRNAEAETAYVRALGLEKLLDQDAKPDAFFLSALANNDDNLGTLYAHTGRGAEAEKMHLAGMEIRERLVREHPDVSENSSALIKSYNNLATLYALSDRAVKAAPYLEKSAEICARLVREQPGMPDLENDLGATLNNLGGVYTLLDKPKEARATHERALAVREKLAREHPAILEYRLHLAGTYTNLGELDCRAGDAQHGLDGLDRAATQLESVLAAHPEEPTARYYLSYTSSWRGKALNELGRAADALVAWDRAIALDDHADKTLHIGRAESLARLGRHADAAAEAARAAESSTLKSEELCSLASVLCRCLRAAASDTNDSARAQQMYATSAIDLLRRAAKQSESARKSVSSFLASPDLEPLHGRAELAVLRSELGLH